MAITGPHSSFFPEVQELEVTAESFPPSGASLAAIRKALRITPDLKDFESFKNGTDWSPAVVEGARQASLEQGGRLIIPKGVYEMNTPIIMPYNAFLEGVSISDSVFVHKHNGIAFRRTGALGDAVGGGISKITIGFQSPSGTPTCQLFVDNFQEVSNPTNHYSPDFYRVNDMNFTYFGGNMPQYNWIMDGNGRWNDVGGTIPQGLRSCRASGVTCFAASVRAVEIRHCRDLTIADLSIYGSGGAGGMLVTGSGSAPAISYDVKVMGATINFGLTVDNAQGVYAVATTVGTDLSLTANARNFVGAGVVGGSIADNTPAGNSKTDQML